MCVCILYIKCILSPIFQSNFKFYRVSYQLRNEPILKYEVEQKRPTCTRWMSACEPRPKQSADHLMSVNLNPEEEGGFTVLSPRTHTLT